jgi:hypothetical protein
LIHLKENIIIALELLEGTNGHPTDGCRFEGLWLLRKKDGYEILTQWPKDGITEFS